MNPLLAEIKRLFAEFLPSELEERFATLLEMDPKHWRKIDPWKLWEVKSTKIHPWPERPPLPCKEFIRQPEIAHLQHEPVVVLRCGHSSPSVKRETFGPVLGGESWILEGFVSVTNYKLGFAFNHDGMIRILSMRAPKSRFQGPHPLQDWSPEPRKEGG